MKNKEMQVAMAASGFYTGGIDGDLGPKFKQGCDACAAKYGHLYTFKVMVWREYTSHVKNKRKITAAVQACLNALGFDCGAVDGYKGHNTREAMSALLYKLATGKDEHVPRVKKLIQPKTSLEIPHQREMRDFYGDPDTQVSGLLETIVLPFRMRIDYNLKQSTNKMTVHQLCAPSLKAAMIEVHGHYGMPRMRELGLDRYAGGYNKRPMRGGSKWSTHAYGCAVDFFARPNGLRMKCPQALFCRDEYKDFLDIMESHEWLAALRLWGADAMHFQRAKL